MCQLSWFLDPGGWSKTAAVGLYFIFPGTCTLSLSNQERGPAPYRGKTVELALVLTARGKAMIQKQNNSENHCGIVSELRLGCEGEVFLLLLLPGYQDASNFAATVFASAVTLSFATGKQMASCKRKSIPDFFLCHIQSILNYVKILDTFEVEFWQVMMCGFVKTQVAINVLTYIGILNVLHCYVAANIQSHCGRTAELLWKHTVLALIVIYCLYTVMFPEP
ncbi:hypothetical protein STEG23_029136 [Scotinomys teguina]